MQQSRPAGRLRCQVAFYTRTLPARSWLRTMRTARRWWTRSIRALQIRLTSSLQFEEHWPREPFLHRFLWTFVRPWRLISRKVLNKRWTSRWWWSLWWRSTPFCLPHIVFLHPHREMNIQTEYQSLRPPRFSLPMQWLRKSFLASHQQRCKHAPVVPKHGRATDKFLPSRWPDGNSPSRR